MFFKKKEKEIEKKERRTKWFLDFNGSPTCLELFHASKLENRIYFTFTFTYFVLLFLKSFIFAHGSVECE